MGQSDYQGLKEIFSKILRAATLKDIAKRERCDYAAGLAETRGAHFVLTENTE